LAEYENIVSRLAAELDIANYDRAVTIAALPDMVRGYEDIKLASVEGYHARLRELGVNPSA
jgi:indolepyruvate ferredoxin oxidoreductase